eukprot:CCRYP_002121-RA/>CCRYP_002121-RA protein AED:0.47 eAED:0.75 QI:0/0/0/1/0/0/2/0/66
MGLKCSTDTAQSIIESVLSGIEDADAYIDNIGVGSSCQAPRHNLVTTAGEWFYYISAQMRMGSSGD